jgi:hypothetical protein
MKSVKCYMLHNFYLPDTLENIEIQIKMIKFLDQMTQ